MIWIDYREKKFKHITDYFEANNIEFECGHKISFGDYRNKDDNGVCIERKANFQELSANCGKKHKQFKNELERLKASGGKMYVLIENNKTLEDVKSYVSPYQTYFKTKSGNIYNTTIDGLKMHNILVKWKEHYNIEYVFCDRKNSGKIIKELLEKGND